MKKRLIKQSLSILEMVARTSKKEKESWITVNEMEQSILFYGLMKQMESLAGGAQQNQEQIPKVCFRRLETMTISSSKYQLKFREKTTFIITVHI